jgi:hypothetical protein
MTQDEIIEMAEQSDLGFLLGDSWLLHHELEYFAKLVAQHEREACEKICLELAKDMTRVGEFAAMLCAKMIREKK